MMRFAAKYVMGAGYDFGRSFGFGLDLILDGLDKAAMQAEGRAQEAGGARQTAEPRRQKAR